MAFAEVQYEVNEFHSLKYMPSILYKGSDSKYSYFYCTKDIRSKIDRGDYHFKLLNTNVPKALPCFELTETQKLWRESISYFLSHP